jgi:hypothetical protein
MPERSKEYSTLTPWNTTLNFELDDLGIITKFSMIAIK